MRRLLKTVPFLIIILSVLIFFYPFVLQGKLPIPGDTIVGLYYPFRDLYSATNPNGLPYKNFLVTDPVRQQYPWKNLATTLEKNFELPLWSPYEMAGTPLLANFQSGPFYPLNFLLFIPPFYFSWSVFILLEPLLAGLFLYLYLKNLKLDSRAALLGAIAWMFCGFSIAWLEWGVVLHTALWLPLILLAIDKLMSVSDGKKSLWAIVLIFSLSAGLLAGHLQIFFYLTVFSFVYYISRAVQYKNALSAGFIFLCFLISAFLTFLQWYPTLQFILLSNRALDQTFTQPGWFIPYQNLIQFIAPDFFGNPATLNYFGVWNYAEFIGYIGIIPLILALFAVMFRRDKKVWFFLTATVVCLVFALPNFISEMPFVLKIPFIETAQPTRLLFLIDFSLAILAALGFDFLLKKKSKIWGPILIIGVVIVVLWSGFYLWKGLFPGAQDLLVSKNNLKLPTLLFFISSLILLGFEFIKIDKILRIFVVCVFVVMLFDLLRFGWKFTPFTGPQYLYPDTKVTKFLQNRPGVFRIATTDSRILPPNFSVMYKLQSIEGYDPLYLSDYAKLIAANERPDHSVMPPYGFNRIITPRNLGTQIIDLLNVKYILSLDSINNPKFKKVFEDGKTKVYENTNAFPRAFFVQNIISAANDPDAAKMLFENDLSKKAVIVSNKRDDTVFEKGKADVSYYSPDKVIIETRDSGAGFLVLSDVYYPSFHATIDGVESNILRVDLAFRGVRVPAGKHTVIFKPSLF